MEKLYSMLEDNSGGLSTTRVCLLIVVLTVLINWSWVNYNKKELVPFPDNSVVIIAIMAGAKVAQKFGEKGEIKINPPPKIKS